VGNTEECHKILNNQEPLHEVATGADETGQTAGRSGGDATASGPDTPESERRDTRPTDGREAGQTAGRGDGRADGRAAARGGDAPAWEPAGDDRGAPEACPTCGSTAIEEIDRNVVVLADGRTVGVEDTDRYCGACDVLIDASGNTYK
jgi:hypothetical protein